MWIGTTVPCDFDKSSKPQIAGASGPPETRASYISTFCSACQKTGQSFAARPMHGCNKYWSKYEILRGRLGHRAHARRKIDDGPGIVVCRCYRWPGTSGRHISSSVRSIRILMILLTTERTFDVFPLRSLEWLKYSAIPSVIAAVIKKWWNISFYVMSPNQPWCSHRFVQVLSAQWNRSDPYGS